MKRISLKALLLAITTVGLTVNATGSAFAQSEPVTNQSDALVAQFPFPIPIPIPVRRDDHRDDWRYRYDNDPGKRSDGSWQERHYDPRYTGQYDRRRVSPYDYEYRWGDRQQDLRRELARCDRKDDRSDRRECVRDAYDDYYDN